MKRMLNVVLALIFLVVFSTAAYAALPERNLYSPALEQMTFLEGETFPEGHTELYMSEDGLIFVEILTLEATGYAMVGEVSFADFLELRAEGEMSPLEEIPCEGICSYPAQRMRFEMGANEDLSVMDATAIWTDSKTFVYMVQTSADTWYGFMEGYEEGDVAALVEQWLSELELTGYDTGAEEFVLTDATLVADRSCGSENAEELGLIERYETLMEGVVDAYLLADRLSALTGLDFVIDYAYDEDGNIVVDWQSASTLVAGLDDREQSEDFFFYDAVTLNWFMMDSLYATLCENLGVETVYYTMDGGQELCPTELDVLESFPTDVPYMGSAFYYAHSDVVGD